MNEEAEKIVEEVAEEKNVNLEDTILPEFKIDELYEEEGGEVLRLTMENVFEIMDSNKGGNIV